MNRPQPAQSNAFTEAREWFLSLPVVTRTLVALYAGVTLAGNLGIVSPYNLILEREALLRRLQLWRVVTPFFFDKLGFNFLVNLYFLYKTSLELETELFASRPADYAWFLLLSMGGMLIPGLLVPFYLLSEGLSMAIIYIWSIFNQEKRVSFMFGIQFKALYFPWALLAMDFLTVGQFPWTKLAGLVVAHAYYFLDRVYPDSPGGRRVIVTPAFVSAWFPPAPPRPAGGGGGGTPATMGGVQGSVGGARSGGVGGFSGPVRRPTAEGSSYSFAGTGYRLGSE
ncbi:DER1-domain-containing protein [Gonapodya prolifera JEL478]|uniref:Derlin n=1 Tax=Gonapodya prolifera (strain JEL478) TaxID=1344416 RepID=A0A139AZ72_GONPJ|nr:DER1-domain-containing protein [Gonapodya prolifera JEL478]|eukprot:KXS22031.1 DER1-domain-containing protein [Gonapodya prolifera JEL478]